MSFRTVSPQQSLHPTERLSSPPGRPSGKSSFLSLILSVAGNAASLVHRVQYLPLTKISITHIGKIVPLPTHTVEKCDRKGVNDGTARAQVVQIINSARFSILYINGTDLRELWHIGSGHLSCQSHQGSRVFFTLGSITRQSFKLKLPYKEI